MNIQKAIGLVSVFIASMNCFALKAQKTGQYNNLNPNLGCIYKLFDFYAQFRRSYPARGVIHTHIDRIKADRCYIGAYLACQFNNRGWLVPGRAPFSFSQTSFLK